MYLGRKRCIARCSFFRILNSPTTHKHMHVYWVTVNWMYILQVRASFKLCYTQPINPSPPLITQILHVIPRDLATVPSYLIALHLTIFWFLTKERSAKYYRKLTLLNPVIHDICTYHMYLLSTSWYILPTTYIHAYTHTYIHTFIHTYISWCIIIIIHYLKTMQK